MLISIFYRDNILQNRMYAEWCRYAVPLKLLTLPFLQMGPELRHSSSIGATPFVTQNMKVLIRCSAPSP